MKKDEIIKVGEKNLPFKTDPNDFYMDITDKVSDLDDLNNLQLKINLKQEDVVHFGVTCDSCHQSNFNGIRFKCNKCEDFDLCEKCHSTVKHFDGKHTFETIKRSNRLPFKNIITHVIPEEKFEKKINKEEKKEIKEEKKEVKEEKKEIKEEKKVIQEEKKKKLKKKKKKLKKKKKKLKN